MADTARIRALPVYLALLVVFDLAVTIAVWVSAGYKLGVLDFLQISVEKFAFDSSLFDLLCLSMIQN